MIEVRLIIEQDELGIKFRTVGKNSPEGATDFECEFAEKLMKVVNDAVQKVAEDTGALGKVETIPFTTIRTSRVPGAETKEPKGEREFTTPQLMEALNNISTDPLRRVDFVKAYSDRIRFLAGMPTEALEQILMAEHTIWEATSQPDVDAKAKALWAKLHPNEDVEAKWRRSDQNRNRAVALITAFKDKVKPLLEEIIADIGYTDKEDFLKDEDTAQD